MDRKKLFELQQGYRINAPFQPRCYISNDTQVEVVCHHCGRSISPSSENFVTEMSHKRKLINQLKTKESPQTSLIRKLIDKIPYFKNQEFTQLQLQPDEGIHCKYCSHHFGLSKNLFIMVIGIVVVAWLFGWENVSGPIGILKFLVIALSILVLYLDWDVYEKQKVHQRPSLPVFGRMPDIAIEEQVKGEIELNGEGQYSAKPKGEGNGKIVFSTNLTPSDEKRLESYRRKFKLSSREKMKQHAGFVLFQISKKIDVTNGVRLIPRRVNTLALIKMAKSLRDPRQRVSASTWSVNSNYRFPLSQSEQDTLPIQIVPSIIAEGKNQTALELTIQVNPQLINKPLAKADVFVQKLRLENPGTGNVERAHPSPVNLAGNRLSVEWQKVKLLRSDWGNEVRILWGNEQKVVSLPELGIQTQDEPKVTFYVRYASPIRPEMKLSGSMDVIFMEAITGINPIQLFTPLGYEVGLENTKVEKRTKISVNFELDLQHLRVKEPFTKSSEPVEKALIPNHKLVNRLVDDLSGRQDIYVQRVIENPPATNKANARVLNRFWELAGRKYVDGLFPIDFRVLVTGREEYEEEKDEPVSGRLRIVATTNTTVIDGYREEADKFFEELNAIINVVGDSAPV